MPSVSLPTAGILAGVSAATSVVGAGIGAYGAISSANATAANASYQAQVARNNQTVASQNAEYAVQAGAAKAAQTSEQGAQRLAKVRTAVAANGIDVNSGSAADDQETQRRTGTLDTLTVVNNAALQAYGYRTQAVNYGDQAGLDTAEASQAPTAGALSAGGGLLSGLSGTATGLEKYQQQAGDSSDGYVSAAGAAP
jgi:hypothetical protein